MKSSLIDLQIRHLKTNISSQHIYVKFSLLTETDIYFAERNFYVLSSLRRASSPSAWTMCGLSLGSWKRFSHSTLLFPAQTSVTPGSSHKNCSAPWPAGVGCCPHSPPSLAMSGTQLPDLLIHLLTFGFSRLWAARAPTPDDIVVCDLNGYTTNTKSAFLIPFQIGKVGDVSHFENYWYLLVTP
jgi:hypothetical protein